MMLETLHLLHNQVIRLPTVCILLEVLAFGKQLWLPYNPALKDGGGSDNNNNHNYFFHLAAAPSYGRLWIRNRFFGEFGGFQPGQSYTGQGYSGFFNDV